MTSLTSTSESRRPDPDPSASRGGAWTRTTYRAGLWHDLVVPLQRVLLLITGATGALSVGAAFLSAWQASMQFGVLMLAVVTVFVAVAGRTAVPRVRWAAVVGLGVLAVVMAVRTTWLDAPASEPWSQTISRERLAATGMLLGVLSFAVGVLALPRRYRPRRAALTTALALLLMAVIGFEVGRKIAGAPVLGLVETAWPALIAVLAAVGLVALSGWRGDRTWFVLGGAALVAVAAATAFDDLMSVGATWQAASVPHADAFLQPGIRVSVAAPQLAAPLGGSAGDVLQPSAALEMALALAGPALLAIGVLQASRGDGQERVGSESS